MSDAKKTPLQRVVDGDHLEAGDIRGAVKELLERLEALEKPTKTVKKVT